MTDKQEIFCNEYIKDFNGARAYKVAYPNCKKDSSARANASELLTKTNIQEYITKLKEDLKEKTQITQEKVLNEISKIAFADIRKLYNDNGGLKSIQDLDDTTAGAIISVESLEEFEGYGDDREQIGYTKKIKMADKTKALDMLGRYFGMFKDKVEVNQDKPFEVNITVKGKSK